MIFSDASITFCDTTGKTRNPYTVGIMDAISDPKIERVVIVSGTQMGKINASILRPIGYYMTYEPCPIMIV
jgi:phage terminase large subunit GpA-like protein